MNAMNVVFSDFFPPHWDLKATVKDIRHPIFSVKLQGNVFLAWAE